MIENVGPIKALDVSFEVNADGTPKPIILVGKNGTGKTYFLAYIIDALVEFGKAQFQDIVPNQRIGRV